MERIKYVIIGNGIAGHAAVKRIRRTDEKGSVLMIGDEKVHTYYRVKLTALLAKDDISGTSVVNDSWYEEHDIQCKLGIHVDDINFEEKKLTLDNGEVVYYEKLLLSMGSHPFVPPIEGRELEGVFTLRTINDLIKIKEFTKDKEKVTVLGGGLLGVESAYSFKQRGHDVTIVEMGKHLLSRQLDEEIGEKLDAAMRKAGYHIYVGKGLDAIKGEGKVESVIIEGEEMPMDAVLFSAGIRPNLELVKDKDIEYNRGVIVNDMMETSVPDVYAAGDCVEYHGYQLGLWTSSNEQGRVAGAAMVGEREEYEQPKIFTTLQVGDINLFSAGNVDQYDEVYRYEDGEVLHKLFVTDGIITGVILTENIRNMNQMVKMIANQEKVEDYLRVGLPYQLEE